MLLGVIFLWSTIEVITKAINDDMHPLWIAFLRFFLGGLVLVPAIWIYRKKVNWKETRLRDWTQLMLLSMLGITATFTLFHLALVGISASSAATLISTVPLFIAPLSLLILKERMGIVGMAGIVLGAAGIVIISVSEGGGLSFNSSPIMILFSVICFSVYSVMMKPLNKRIDPRVTTPISLIVGSLFMIPLLMIRGASLDIASISAMSWAGLLFMSFISVGLAYMLFFIALDKIEVSKGSSFFYLKPIIASFLAWAFLYEAPSAVRVLSIFLISFSIYLVVAEKAVKRFILRYRSGKVQ